MNLSTAILAALGLGAIFGTLLNTQFPAEIVLLDRYLLTPLGTVFLRAIQFVVVPIVFSSLILGLTGIRSTGKIGRYVAKLMAIYVVTGCIALALGMSFALGLQPGMGIAGGTIGLPVVPTSTPDLLTWAIELIPVNPIAALSNGNLLQVIFSAALFSIGIQLIPARSAQPFVDLMSSIYQICEKILGVILYIAPVGVFALMSSVIATQGLDLVAKLLIYVLELLAASIIMAGIYLAILWAIKAEPKKLIQSLLPSLSLAFGTASSNAILPLILRDLQVEYGLREEIASFAIPLGTVLKRDGSAILQSFNALFIAQIYHVPMTPSLLVAVGLSSLLVSFCTPGVPGSALISMATVLSAAGLPLEGIALVAGVDRLTDGFKTVLNAIGNSATAILLSYWESESPHLPEPLPANAAPIREEVMASSKLKNPSRLD
jgi:proton glutamate symport protein